MFINAAVVMLIWNNIVPNVYVFTTALLSNIWFTKKFSVLHVNAFSQKP